MTQVRSMTTAELSGVELEALRRLLFGAFGGRFEEHDWEHTLGGVHVLAVEDDDQVVAHAAVVPRVLSTGGGELRTGYVEGVATRADRRGRERTAEDDGSVLVLRTPATGALEVTGSITCDWRPGDVW